MLCIMYFIVSLEPLDYNISFTNSNILMYSNLYMLSFHQNTS